MFIHVIADFDVAEEQNLLVGEVTAERLKTAIGTALIPEDGRGITIQDGIAVEAVSWQFDVRMICMAGPDRKADVMDVERIREYLRQGEGAPPPVFVGRDAILADILKASRESAGQPKMTRIVQGAPGAGKS